MAPYGSNLVVVNKIFRRANPACSNSVPKWTNLHKATRDNIQTETEIGGKEKAEVMRQ